jgi:hypothetical protein
MASAGERCRLVAVAAASWSLLLHATATPMQNCGAGGRVQSRFPAVRGDARYSCGSTRLLGTASWNH